MEAGFYAGKLIHDARAARGISQARLAEVLGVTQPAVARLEASTNPRVETLRKALNATGMELELRAVPIGDPVDLGQIRRHLSMTPEQRRRAHRAALRNVGSLVRDIRRVE